MADRIIGAHTMYVSSGESIGTVIENSLREARRDGMPVVFVHNGTRVVVHAKDGSDELFQYWLMRREQLRRTRQIGMEASDDE